MPRSHYPETHTDESTSTSRRSLLIAAGAVAGTAGCLKILAEDGDNSDSDSDSDGNSGNDSDGDSDNGGKGQNEADTDSDELNQTNTTDQSEGGEDNSPESNNESAAQENESREDDEEPPLTPEENETEPDRERYNDTDAEQQETVALDPSTVSVEPEAHDTGTDVVLKGTVTNTSEQYVSAVSLDYSFYDYNDEYIGGYTVTVRELEPDETKDYEEVMGKENLQAEIGQRPELDVMVYGPPTD